MLALQSWFCTLDVSRSVMNKTKKKVFMNKTKKKVFDRGRVRTCDISRVKRT